jgi:CelD/BcsL family acetyltransferase involved in cellulose biosynthesis
MITATAPPGTPPDTNITVTVVPSRSLSEEQMAAWRGIQRMSPVLDNPFFSPEFTQAVASFRLGVEVAVLQRAGRVIGFFPFRRRSETVAEPVGGDLSGVHGLIIDESASDSPVRLDPRGLLEQCGLKAWEFIHVPLQQRVLEPYHWVRHRSPRTDLSDGFDAYYRARRHAGSSTICKTLRKMRKIEREVGPLRFVADATDPRVFCRLLEWKVKRYECTCRVNHLRAPWKVALLRHLAVKREEHFGGRLSALYAGKHLLAVHLGLLSSGVLHGWFPAFNEQFARYSPGLVFWVRLMQEAEQMGVRRIEWGRGDARYKDSLGNGCSWLGEGAIDLRPVARLVHRGNCIAWNWFNSTPLKGPLQHVVRLLRSYRHTQPCTHKVQLENRCRR